jgi:Protein of unknown function (DUF1064)
MTDRETWTQWIKARADGLQIPVRVPRPNKYHARGQVVDGIRFDSTREAARFRELKLLAAAGLISHLEIHPGYPLQVVALHREGPPWEITTIGMVHFDFRYRDLKTGDFVIEDVKCKATKTPAYQLRKKIAEAVHGITVREIE